MTVMVFEACIKMWNCHHLDAVIKCVLAWSLYYTVMNITKCKPGAVWQCDPRAPGSWVDPRVQARWCDALLPPWRPWRPAPPCEMSLAGSQSLVPNTSLAGVPVGRNATAAQSQQGRHLCVSNLHSGLGQHKRVYPGSPATATHPHTRMGWSLLAWI